MRFEHCYCSDPRAEQVNSLIDGFNYRSSSYQEILCITNATPTLRMSYLDKQDRYEF